MVNDIYQVLQDLGISFTKIDHPAVFTVAESEKFEIDNEAKNTKNLFLRNQKGNKHYLVVVESRKKVDLKNLANLIGDGRLSFASPERLQKYLGVTPGSVSILGLINDTEKEVRVVVDEDLLKGQKIACHPNINTSTLVITPLDLTKFLQYTGHTVSYFLL